MEESFGTLAPTWSTGFAGSQLAFVSHNRVAYCSGSNIKVVDIDGGKENTIRSFGDGVHCLVGSGSNKHSYFAYTETCVNPRLFIVDPDRPQYEPMYTLDIDSSHQRLAYAGVGFIREGSILVTVEEQPTNILTLWDLSRDKPEKLIEEPTGFVGAFSEVEIQVSYCSATVFSVATETEMFVWHLDVCNEVYNLSSRFVFCLSPCICRGLLAALLDLRKISLISVPRRTSLTRRSSVAEILDLDKFVSASRKVKITCHAWSKSSDEVYIGTDDGLIMCNDGKSSTCTISKRGRVGSVSRMAIAGDTMVITSEQGSATWLNIKDDFEEVGWLSTEHTQCMVEAGGRIVAGCQGSLALLEQSGETSIVTTFKGSIVGIGYVGKDPDLCAVAVSKDGEMFVWTGHTGEFIDRFDLKDTITCVATSNASSLVVACCESGQVLGLDVRPKAQRIIYSELVHTDSVEFAQIHLNGNYYVTVGDGKLVLCRVSPKADQDAFAPVGYGSIEGSVINVSMDSDTSAGIRVAVGVRTPTRCVIQIFTFQDDITTGIADRVERKTCDVDFDFNCVTLTNNRLFVQRNFGDVYTTSVDNSRNTINPVSSKIVCGHVLSSWSRTTSAAAGNLIASMGVDGMLMVRLADDSTCCEQPVAAVCHQIITPNADGTGSCFIGSSATGKTLLTSDGKSISSWHFETGSRKSIDVAAELSSKVSEFLECTSLAADAVLNCPTVPQDTDETEKTLVELIMSTEESEVAAQKQDEREKLLRRVENIRKKVQALIDENEEKPDLEKLDRKEFQLDLAEQERTAEESTAKLAELRKTLEYEILAQQYLRHKIKKMCWDSMEVKGKTVYTYSGKLEVSNYPLRIRSKTELAELRQVKFSRKIEIEHAKVRSLQNGSAEADAEVEDDEESSNFYNHLSLYSGVKKRAQIVLLRDHIHQIKSKFNMTHQEVCEDKKSESRKILEKNRQIMRVVNELKLGGVEVSVDLFEPEEHLLEDPEQLLTVNDSEIKVEHVLNEEELKLKAEEDAREVERQRLAAMDNPRERGLIDMMNGRLEDGKEDELWQDLVPPSFVAEVPSEQWSDSQKYKAEEYNQRIAEQQDMRGKRIKALNTELSNLKATVTQAKMSFDERVSSLFNDKIQIEQQIYQAELKILLLMRSLQHEENMLKSESEVVDQIQFCKSIRPHLASKVEEANATIDAFMVKFVKIEKANKVLDKGFKQKMLSAFPEAEEHIDVLLKLFRKRAKKNSKKITRAMSNVELVAAAPSLDKTADCPPGLSDEAWAKLAELRFQKLENDRVLAAAQDDLNRMHEYRDRRLKEEKEIADKLDGLLDDLHDLRQQRFTDAVNVEVLVPIKQGLVEVTHENDFEPEFDRTVLIPRKVVEDLNSEVLRLGQEKLDHLRQRMQFRKRSHMLEWEHKRLKMLKEDLNQKLRDIQLLRVTRNVELEGGISEDEKNRRENDMLEKTIQRLQETMEKKITYRKKYLADLEREITSYKNQNKQLQSQVESLNATVDQHNTVHRVLMANKGPNLAQERLKAAARRSRMIEIVKAQESQMASLREEVDRMRRKTFPAFVPGHKAAF